MIYPNLLDLIELDESIQKDIFKYDCLLGEEVEPYVKAYMNGELTIQQAIEMLDPLKTKEISVYAIHLLFVLRASEYLYLKYKKNNLGTELFIDTMKDIKYKTDECIKELGIVGITVLWWFDGFFKLERFGFGRLQYDVCISEEDIELSRYTLKKGDFFIQTHIPSGSPLEHELCIESYKMAYEFFKNRLSNNILPIKCESWLLFPPYIDQGVFAKGTNIYNFATDYERVGQVAKETLMPAHSVFNMDYNGNVEELPQNTGLQKRFVSYIKNGGTFGRGIGVLLFDGRKIVNK